MMMFTGLWLFGCATGSVYRLDSDSRAQSGGAALTLLTSRVEFDRMWRQHDPAKFDVWSNKLQQLKPGMLRAEVFPKLNSESEREVRVELSTVTGSGQHEIWILDDAYCAYLTFSFVVAEVERGVISRRDSDQLISAPQLPSAISYRVH